MKKELIDVMITEAAIQKRVEELGEEISRDYSGQKVLLIGILKGAVVLLADLMRKITIDMEIDFIAVSSYGDGTESSGVVKIDKDVGQSIEGKHVILVEDILDTGTTLSSLSKHFAKGNPESLKICVLLDKPERRTKTDVRADYIGFTIPDKFVVGYGLDYAQRYRQVPYIGVLRFEE